MSNQLPSSNEQKSRKLYPIGSTFNIPGLPETAVLEGMGCTDDRVPDADPFYEWDTDRVRDLSMFWRAGFKAMMIEGDPSAGKTSLVRQWHAKLGVPLCSVPCSPDTQSIQVFGAMLPKESGGVHWVDGPVTKACREGTSVLLDEFNLMDPGQAAGLNMVLEGYSWTIVETGEVVKPAPTTRFFVTQNAIDSLAAVAGRNSQDVATDDRFVYMPVDFMPASQEEKLVARRLVAGQVAPDLANTIARITVQVANDVRTAFRDGSPDIDKPLSTRAVIRWATFTAMYTPGMKAKGRSGMHFAITRAVKMNSTMAQAVEDMITLRLGVDKDLKAKA